VLQIPQVECNADEFAEPSFELDARNGSAVFTDASHVDVSRTLPHLLAAMPEQTQSRRTALAATYPKDVWNASLEDKAVFVVPHLTGSCTNAVPLSQGQTEAVLSYVQAGGVMVVAGSPLCALPFINAMFDASITKDGDILFMSGLETIQAHPDFESNNEHGVCTDNTPWTWPNQNSFHFVGESSLPNPHRVMFEGSTGTTGDAKKKVAAFDFVPNGSRGRVLFFGFDFYDVPSPDVACALRVAVQSSMAAAAEDVRKALLSAEGANI